MTAESDAIRALNDATAELRQAQNDIERLRNGPTYNIPNPLPRTIVRLADAYVDLGRAAEKYGRRSREMAEVIRAQASENAAG